MTKNPNPDLLAKKAEKAARKLSLSEADAKIIRYTAYGIYDEIAYDLPAENRRGTVRRSTLIEVCLDAGRLEMRLEQKRQDLAVIVQKADYATLIDLVGPAFGYAEYEAGPAE